MGRLQEEQLSLDNKCFKKGRIYPLLFYYIFSMRKILAVVSLFALGVSAAFAAEPTDLDSLFRGHEYKPVLNASLRDSADSQQSAAVVKANTKSGKSDGYYMLQFEAVADFDAAQRRRAQLSASTGYAIQVVFDSPFYKLRGGGWTTKKAAEDKARELSAYNINAFVVKVK